MKNIHLISTDKPSRLYLGNNGNFVFGMIQTSIQSRNDDFTNQNIYITSNEEIKEGDWVMSLYTDTPQKISKSDFLDEEYYKKIILTTDQELIKDGVQAIDDEFLEWFVKNPSCEKVEVESKITKDGVWTDLKGYVELPTTHSIIHKIIIPKEEPKQENIMSNERILEEAAQRYSDDWENITGLDYEDEFPEAINKLDFINGAKWQQQQQRSYSEEDMKQAFLDGMFHSSGDTVDEAIEEWFNQFKKK